MKTCRIGRIDFEPTVLGLGCWVFGGRDWGAQNDADSAATIEEALALGINHFDTAQGYGAGHSEQLCGQYLQSVREQVFIATKSDLTPRQEVQAKIDTSLKRLRCEMIDIFYIHWPKKGAEMRPMMEELERARDKEKIRGIGVSNFSVAQMEQVMEVGHIDAHQLCYNLLWRQDEADVIPFCIENDISVVTYSSIAQGILTGKYHRHNEFAPDDQRPQTVLFVKDVWPHIFEAVEEMKIIAREANRPLHHLALLWAASQPGVKSVLVGARNPQQIQDNVQAVDGEVEAEIFNRLTAISDRAIKHLPDVRNIFWNDVN
jgi:aryl-alcohol dehydrogenase-like predicted oxidoreductase